MWDVISHPYPYFNGSLEGFYDKRPDDFLNI